MCPLTREGWVQVLEWGGEFIPAGSLKFKVTCPSVPHASPATMLLEPGGSDLAPGLLLSLSLLCMVNEVAYVPVVNVGATSATVHSKQVLGMLHSVEGIEGQQLSFDGEGENVAHNRTQTVGEPSAPISEVIANSQWPRLSPTQEKQVRGLLERYNRASLNMREISAAMRI